MQVSINNQTKTPQFCMAIQLKEPVNKVIKLRLKNSLQQEKLNKIINKQADNDTMDIVFFTDGKSLTANVYPKKIVNLEDYPLYCRSFSENCISKMFKGVVGFVEKVANYADVTSAKIRKSSNINN